MTSLRDAMDMMNNRKNVIGKDFEEHSTVVDGRLQTTGGISSEDYQLLLSEFELSYEDEALPEAMIMADMARQCILATQQAPSKVFPEVVAGIWIDGLMVGMKLERMKQEEQN